jgi:hypothetical protein
MMTFGAARSMREGGDGFRYTVSHLRFGERWDIVSPSSVQYQNKPLYYNFKSFFFLLSEVPFVRHRT